MNKVEAIRLTACMCEDGVFKFSVVKGIFVELLRHERAHIRYVAAESIWQCLSDENIKANSDLKENMENALNQETHPEVKAVLQHVLDIILY